MFIHPTAGDHLEGTEAHPHVYFAEDMTLSKALERLCCLLLHKLKKNKQKKPTHFTKKKTPKDVIDTLSQLQRCLILYVQDYRRKTILFFCADASETTTLHPGLTPLPP